jgi:nitroreductase / dihydropteridine reductase
MSFHDHLNWRYATKRMNGSKIETKKLQSILEAIRLAPTSMGLQPFSVVVVDDLKTRQAMAPVCFNQPQITESSAVLVFSIWKNITEKEVTIFIENIAKTRGVTAESLEGFRNNLMGLVNGKTHEELQIWAARQAYIALGIGLAACAIEEVDSTPMEGFNPAGLDEVLHLDEKGLKSVVMLSIGYRDAQKDFLNGKAKVRRASKDFFIKI